MKAKRYFCESCGRELKTQDAICLHCDVTLSEAAQNPPAWRTPCNNKICPMCGEGFNDGRINFVPWPKDAAWYRLQIYKLACPHCKGYLKSKYNFPSQQWPMWVTLLAVFSLLIKLPERFIPPPYGFIFEWLLLAILICISAISGYRQSRDKNSYIPDNNL